VVPRVAWCTTLLETGLSGISKGHHCTCDPWTTSSLLVLGVTGTYSMGDGVGRQLKGGDD
jgi:hypothetical protein